MNCGTDDGEGIVSSVKSEYCESNYIMDLERKVKVENVENNEDNSDIKYELGIEEVFIKEEYSCDIENSYDNAIKCKICPFSTKLEHSLTELKEHYTSKHAPDKTTQMFHCAECSYNGKTKKNLQCHTRFMHQINRPTYNCIHCDYRGKKKHSLTRHMVIHDVNPETFQCPQCSYTTRRKYDLASHFKVHQNSVLGCFQCDFKTKVKRSLLTHMLTHQDNFRIFNCSYCNYKAKTVAVLNRHLALHETKSFNCAHCTLSFIRKQALSQHLKNKHNNKSEVVSNLVTHQENFVFFHCTQCDFKTRRKGSLRDHLVLKHETNFTKFNCPHCVFNSPVKVLLENHIKINHLVVNPNNYHCSHCEYTTRFKKNLNYHILKLHDSGNNFFYCYNCNFKTKVKSILCDHMRKHQKNPATLKCPHCNRQYLKKAYLEFHIKLCHSNNVFDCKKCDYKVKTKSLLKSHVFQHHTPMLQCDHCNYSSKIKCNLKQHMRTKHLITTYNHNDQICNYKTEVVKAKPEFPSHVLGNHNEDPVFVKTCKEDLSDHLTVHQIEEVDVECYHCDCKYRGLNGLERHIRMLHPHSASTRVCEHCPRKSTSRCSLKFHMENLNKIIIE